uniref:BPTI/Kunitz inhibitor domain-containing protein n=1 Tax=Meloidogyne incognita TaxID=6306 RepID=A0A914LUW2_MELIC
MSDFVPTRKRIRNSEKISDKIRRWLKFIKKNSEIYSDFYKNSEKILGGNPCLQPCNPGQGFYQLTRWFWDAAADCCRQFTYKGQKGNQNNFVSLEECNNACYAPPNPCRQPIQLPLVPCQPGPEACEGRNDLYCHIGSTPETTVCCPIDQGDKCQLPIEPGEGTAQLPRFGYEPSTQQCHQFIYRGLKGNQNNFLTLEECQLACLPNPCPSERTPFVGADGRIQSCAVSTSMNTCPNNYWCHVGANAASTVCCPDANPNPCQLPMSTGEGFAQLERFYYDSASKTCKSFFYKGLKGNQNNFLNLRACQLACLPLDNPCIGQPAKSESGQVFFCSATNRDTCPVNFWCHLGAVPETTVCSTNPCSVPLAPGTGNAGLARWYYNADERQCISFQYNGKRGNQNNFLTSEECQNICPAALCLLSIDKGSCSSRQTRYAFSREKGQCISFEYSGCGGNLNNFLNMQECQQICSSVRL